MRRCALISVTDKTGVAEFARGLVELGFALLSTGGTMRAIRDAGVAVQEVADYTGFPELLDGRLKTLHPRVHGGILARRHEGSDLAAMAQHGIDRIDLVAVNLYPFRETARRPGVARDEVIENIDIGGPAMLRSAAKNHADVIVAVDPADYAPILAALRAHGGTVPEDLRRDLAAKAFAHTASYDTAIAAWFAGARPGEPHFCAYLGLWGEKCMDLRYGENPHQRAAFYRDPDAPAPNLATAVQRHGKELSYNNLLDLDAAIGVVFELATPACAIVKHGNPCGTARAATAEGAFRAALAGDPLSAFGGILATNAPLTEALAAVIAKEAGFLEAILAPRVADRAIAALAQASWGASVRVLELGGAPPRDETVRVRPVSGGFLVQTDRPDFLYDGLEVVTAVAPSDLQLGALEFAMRVCKHVKSNAIVLATATADGTFATVGIGAGQMSRVDAVQIAVEKAGARARGAVLASEAFFPFADGLEAAAAAGVVAVIQPGGSKRDAEVVAAADAHRVAMVFTGTRHFRH